MLGEFKKWWSLHRKNIALLLWGYFILQLLLYFPYFLPVELLQSFRLDVTSPLAFLRFYDGPFYVGVAQTFYQFFPGMNNFYSHYGGIIYLTNHFPLFPLIIRGMSLVMPFSLAGLMANQIVSIAGIVVLYRVYLFFMNPREALVVSFVQLLIPLRSLLWHHVANSEPTALLFIAISILLILKKKYWWGLLVAMLVQLTRPLMLIVFPGYFFVALLEEKGRIIKAFSTLVLPLTFIAVEWWFYVAVPDFSFTGRPGGFLSLLANSPFLNFFDQAFSADGIWYLFAGVFAGVFVLYEKGKSNRDYWRLGLLWGPFLFFTLFIRHHDVSRYLWPSLPFVMFIPLKDFFQNRAVQVAIIIMIPALLLASWGVLSQNQMPVTHFIEWLRALGEY
ncbi:hypothetical protein COX05_04945 [candidate division WWE3 bacterium CG22_combo_CG10-13_8_21_14_all_39_12]|uniref:Glycosyltransferase RgtA/B/C/D-like domain-containing protein n=2 Tax=Katanobacteria TaxID=422282 RepID=A0A2M7X2D0_UNCKA|nr:MAG: hypothetical protein COX05_04945 [candidate division WWE3 bacterium CG22_combo_CG10-13_8_21_14_all_39_12]PJA40298.1 MAG: hypothetical protein CO179_02700 [candidate division WWE3 bacterium CG_4_9_14_3_um_filter_39_7]